MPEIALTDAFVKSSKCVTGELVEWSDKQWRGLALRVTAAGVKSWTFRYRDADGNRKRMTLGRYPEVSLVEARQKAIAEQAKIGEGVDPAKARKAAKRQAAATKLETVKEIGERYFVAAEAGRHKPNARKKRPRTIADERSYFNRLIVPAFGSERLAGLTRAQIQAFINDVVDDHAPSAARHARIVLQGIFTYAARQEIVAANPCQFATVPRFEARERVLTDAELRAMWKAFDEVASLNDVTVGRPVALAFMLAAATVQRRAEVTGMKRGELDLGAKLWTIPGERTKNHRTHVVPLSQLAVDLIREALGLAGQSDFVFPSPRGEGKPIGPAALSHAWRRLMPHVKVPDPTPSRPKRMKLVEDIRPHDLRRTGATNMTGERIGIPRFIVSKVLNHSSDTGDSAAVTAVYDRNAYLKEKRAALDAWASLLSSIVA